MLNREFKTVTVVTYNDVFDAFGQKRQSGSTEINIDMVVKLMSEKTTTDVFYTDVDVLGITKSPVNDTQQVKIDGKLYQVLKVIPPYTNRGFYQVLMKAQ